MSAQATAIPFGRDRNLLGVGLFIASESLFFLAIVSAYVVFRAQGLATARAELDVGRTALFSALLFASSGTMGLVSFLTSFDWLLPKGAPSRAPARERVAVRVIMQWLKVRRGACPADRAGSWYRRKLPWP